LTPAQRTASRTTSGNTCPRRARPTRPAGRRLAGSTPAADGLELTHVARDDDSPALAIAHHDRRDSTAQVHHGPLVDDEEQGGSAAGLRLTNEWMVERNSRGNLQLQVVLRLVRRRQAARRSLDTAATMIADSTVVPFVPAGPQRRTALRSRHPGDGALSGVRPWGKLHTFTDCDRAGDQLCTDSCKQRRSE
jgi:hypothetical protein